MTGSRTAAVGAGLFCQKMAAFSLGGSSIKIGEFVNALHKKPAAPEAPAAPTTKVCPYCQSEISIKAVRCPHCTSKLEGFPEIDQ